MAASPMAGIDESRTFVPVAIAVLTVSDSRGPKEDESGKTLVFLTNNLGVNTASFLGPWGTGVFQPLVEPDYYTEEGPYDSIASLNAAYNVNGYPAGPRELTPDVPKMMTMWLTEPGYTSLFNGVDFTGWKFLMGLNCKPAPAGCAKTDPGKTFRVEQSEFVVDGKVYGYTYTDKSYRDFTLRFQVKWVPPADWRGLEDRVK